MQRPVKAFALAVSRWMIGSGPALGYAIDITQLLQQLPLKATPLVGVDSSWHTVHIKPSLGQNLGNGRGSLIRGGVGLGKF